MNRDKIIYWIATGLMSALFLFSASMYIFNNAEIQGAFTALGFPVWVIYPLAAAKILAVVAILSRRSKLLAEWAYAGLFFDSLLAMGAHLNVGDGNAGGAIMAIALLLKPNQG